MRSRAVLPLLLGLFLVGGATGAVDAPAEQARGSIAFVRVSGGVSEIYVIGANGRGLRALTGDGSSDKSDLAWSPDGRTLAFRSNGALTLMDADGRNRRSLVSNRVDAFAWAPDGRTLAYLKNRHLSLVGAGGRERRSLVRADWSIPGVSWSPDGRHIVFSGGVGKVDVVSADGSARRRLTPRGAFDEFPTWSPTGGRIAVTTIERPDLETVAAEQTGEILVMRPDGRGRRTVTHNRQYDSAPVWSPDGASLGGNRFFAGGKVRIFIVRAGGSGERHLARELARAIFFGAWSPNGERAVYERDAGDGTELYITNADGSGRRRLTATYAEDIGPAWSPR